MPAISPGEPTIDTGHTAGTAPRIEFPRHLVLSLDERDAPFKIHVTLEQAPDTSGQRRATNGLAIAIMLAVICGAAVMTASAVLLFSVSDMARLAANIPAYMLYLPPIAATVLTFTAFLLGYLWQRQSSSSTDRN